MQRILERISIRTAEYAQGPFFAFLNDDAVDARQKLAFAPHAAHFVMTFADLMALVFRQEPARDPLQELVNATARDDEGHWRWYLKDLELLGEDRQLRYSDAIQMIWSDRAIRLRTISYQLCKLALAGDSVSRLLLLQCIESTFQVSVTAILPHARQLAARTGIVLTYFGPGHSSVEASHAIHDPVVHRRLRELELDDRRAAELCALVDEVFALFAGFSDDLLVLSNPEPALASRRVSLVLQLTSRGGDPD
jgi:hypothetical protein